MKKLNEQELEHFIHSTLRSLPARRAPRSLEARVMAAIEQQAMIPWYHKAWSHWPAAVRTTFLALATAVTGVVVAGFYLGFNGVQQSGLAVQVGERLSVFASIYRVAAWVVELGTQVVDRIPPLWLYGGATAVALMYVTFFGLGAFAYRTLYRNN